MQFSKPLAAAAVLALSAPLLSATANAQDAIVSGPGYKVSEGTVVHPTASAETGFVSNVFYQEDNEVASPLLRLTGRLAFASADIAEEDAEGAPGAGAPPTFDFSAGLRMTYEEYLTSRNSTIAQRNLGLGADIALTVFPQRKVSFQFSDNFIRTNRPTNFESNKLLSRDVNHLRAAAVIKGNESSLKTTLRFENTLDFFESTGSSFADRQQTLLGGRLDWQFLPITRFYFDASFGINSAIGNGTHSSSTPLRLILGADSAITESTTVRVHTGFVDGFYAAGASYLNAAYGAEFGLRYSPVGRITVGYNHDFTDSINANFYEDHSFELKIDQQIQRVLVGAKAQAILRGYEGISMDVGGGSTRSDFILSLGADAQYVVKEWLALSADYTTQVVATEFRSFVDGQQDDPSYTRHTFMIGATAAF